MYKKSVWRFSPPSLHNLGDVKIFYSVDLVVLMCRVYPRFSSQATRALMYMYSASLHVKNRLREMRIMFIIAKAFVFICVCVCVFNMENWCSVNCSNCLVCFVFGWFCELVSHCFTASDCLSFAISSGTNKRTNQVGSRKCVCDVCVIL